MLVLVHKFPLKCLFCRNKTQGDYCSFLEGQKDDYDSFLQHLSQLKIGFVWGTWSSLLSQQLARVSLLNAHIWMWITFLPLADMALMGCSCAKGLVPLP